MGLALGVGFKGSGAKCQQSVTVGMWRRSRPGSHDEVGGSAVSDPASIIGSA